MGEGPAGLERARAAAAPAETDGAENPADGALERDDFSLVHNQSF